ncbi:hypothetical protein IB643_01680 [Allofrancisella guangzhouensis]|uniref:hypothetical protein n=1 Tax=Allofrancisella guangzhouensis TaxID=594679 RepID=UPI001904CFD7|nr:hypothetical protein [Allofrancisella guangzhouensis]MBK2026866.1 hypothetical protein [Allofrancisella guangzhouensis]
MYQSQHFRQETSYKILAAKANYTTDQKKFFESYSKYEFSLFLFDLNRFVNKKNVELAIKREDPFERDDYWINGQKKFEYLFSAEFDHLSKLSTKYLFTIYNRDPSFPYSHAYVRKKEKKRAYRFEVQVRLPYNKSFLLSSKNSCYWNEFKCGEKKMVYNKCITSITAKIDNPKQIFDSLFERYENINERIRKINSDDTFNKKILYIINIVELLCTIDRLHLLPNGNIRTCVFLMNKELIRFGMLPSILINPNIFDYEFISVIVYEIIRGMDLTSQFYSQDKVINHHLRTIDKKTIIDNISYIASELFLDGNYQYAKTQKVNNSINIKSINCINSYIRFYRFNYFENSHFSSNNIKVEENASKLYFLLCNSNKFAYANVNIKESFYNGLFLHNFLSYGADKAITKYFKLLKRDLIVEFTPRHKLQELLAAEINEGIPGLFVALCGSYFEAVRSYIEAIKTIPGINKQELLAAKIDDGTPGLYMALQNGHFEVVRFYIEAIETIPGINKQELLAAKIGNGTSGLFMALQNNQQETVAVYLQIEDNDSSYANHIMLGFESQRKRLKNKILEWAINYKPGEIKIKKDYSLLISLLSFNRKVIRKNITKSMQLLNGINHWQ